MIQPIEKTTPAEALEIIKELTSCDSVTNMKENLHAMMDSWFIANDGDIDDRLKMYGTFSAITRALTSIEKLN
jgi:hypothetical protein